MDDERGPAACDRRAGHGEVPAIDVRPFAARGPLAKQGLPLEEVMKRTDFSRYRDLFGTTERDKTLFKAYWTDPMTENAWKEAKGLPIVQGEGEVNVRKQSEKKN